MALQISMAVVGSVGFAMLFNLRSKHLFFAALGGGLTWGIYLFCSGWMDSFFACNLAAAIGASIYGEVMAAIFKTPLVIFRIPAMVPLIPGGSLYYTINAALLKDQAAFEEKGMETMAAALAISVGIVAVNLVAGYIRKEGPSH